MHLRASSSPVWPALQAPDNLQMPKPRCSPANPCAVRPVRALSAKALCRGCRRKAALRVHPAPYRALRAAVPSADLARRRCPASRCKGHRLGRVVVRKPRPLAASPCAVKPAHRAEVARRQCRGCRRKAARRVLQAGLALHNNLWAAPARSADPAKRRFPANRCKGRKVGPKAARKRRPLAASPCAVKPAHRAEVARRQCRGCRRKAAPKVRPELPASR